MAAHLFYFVVGKVCYAAYAGSNVCSKLCVNTCMNTCMDTCLVNMFCVLQHSFPASTVAHQQSKNKQLRYTAKLLCGKDARLERKQ